MNAKKDYSMEIFSRFGTVKRARGPFLYTAKRVRITDLYRENGRAVLGWGGTSAFTMLKNALNRGATGSFITDYTQRLDKAVSELLASKRTTGIYFTKEEAVCAAKKISASEPAGWGPWSENEESCPEADCVIIEPLLPWTEGIFILAAKENSGKPENSRRIPSPIEAAVTRTVYDYIQAKAEMSEKDWFMFDPVLTKYWTRRGPRLYTKLSAEVYERFFIHCLDLGILINPDPEGVSWVPFGADRGIFTCLKNRPFDAENN